MKKYLLRLLLAATMVATAFTFVGCAHSEHSGMKGGMMSCCKCSCKKMEPDPANPMKCKMCGHDKADHAQTEEKSGHSEHH